MKYTPDGYGERCRFDAFCKTVLRNEARTHLRDLGRQRPFDVLNVLRVHSPGTVDTPGKYVGYSCMDGACPNGG